MKIMAISTLSLLLVLLSGCSEDAREARGFSLPAGDPEKGEMVYRSMKCNACHSLPDIAQLAPQDESGVSVKLGGEVPRLRTYGELVTSVINPSHRLAWGLDPESITTTDGKSRMAVYNDVMTVSQLIDLVSYLEPQYKLRPYEHTSYYPYYP